MPGIRGPVPWYPVVLRITGDDPEATRQLVEEFEQPDRAEALARWLAKEMGLDAIDFAGLKKTREQESRGHGRPT